MKKVGFGDGSDSIIYGFLTQYMVDGRYQPRVASVERC